MSPLKFITISELKSNAKKIFNRRVQRTGKQVVRSHSTEKPIVILGPAPEENFEFQSKEKINSILKTEKKTRWTMGMIKRPSEFLTMDEVKALLRVPIGDPQRQA